MLFAIETDWANFGLGAAIAAPLLFGLLWFMRHVITIMLPAVIKANNETVEKLSLSSSTTIDKIVSSHAATIDKMIEKNSIEQEKARKQYYDMTVEERATCERRHEENKELHEHRYDEWKAVHQEMIASLKDIRHAVAGVSNQITAHHAVMDHIAGVKRIAPGA